MRIIQKKPVALIAALLSLCLLLPTACWEQSEIVVLPPEDPTSVPTSALVSEVDTPVPETPAPEPETPTPAPETPTPEPETPTPAPETPTPATFTFGGAELPVGITSIDSGTGDDYGNKVVGERTKIKHITREEVEALVNLCPNIRKLDLDYCYLDDYTPLAKLTGLTSLSLMTCGNQEGGGVKLTDIDWIASLKNLKQLNLCHNAIDDISAIAGLDQLEYLNLADNDLRDGQLRHLTGLYNLRELDLYQLPDLSDVSPLAELTNLEYLHLGQDHSIKTVKPLTGLKNLKKLRLNDTAVEDISYLDDFKSLQYLDLSKCSRSVNAYYALENCPKLKAVTISDASDDVKSVFYNLSPIELWAKWNDASSRLVPPKP